MQFHKLRRRGIAAAAMIAAAVLGLSQGAMAEPSGTNPQKAPLSAKALAAAVPDQCIRMVQMNSDEQKYRLTYNAPQTYTAGVYGANWFDIKCGTLTFTVPRGFDSMIDFSAVGELDCSAPNSPSPNNGWCESRFQVNVVNVLPNNGGRGDTFAWDSSNGGSFDWQANKLEQVGHVVCPRDPNATWPCTYTARLQGRLQNGADYLWVDDLTVKIDVSEGPVAVTTLVP